MIKKDITGMTNKEQLQARAKDRVHSFLLADGQVRGAIVHGTHVVREMQVNHQLGILETMVLGQAYLGVLLMTANLKGNDRIAFKIQCSGPIKGLSVEASAKGDVRGFLNVVPIPVETAPESFDLAPFFGTGLLEVISLPEAAKHPYLGHVKLQYGNPASDLANYYLQSEQTPTAFNLSVKIDGQGNLTGAGGILLQALPGAEDDVIDRLEALAQSLPSIGDMFALGTEPTALVQSHFSELNPKLLGNKRVEFFCPCQKETVGNVIASMEKSELEDILKNDPFPVQSLCHNCNTLYSFQKEEIQAFCDKK